MLLGCCSEFSNMESSATGADGPTPALRWLLSAIGANRLIGLGEIHGSATQHELIRELISHPEFAADDLVIEFGNALYQDVLDAYINGEGIPVERLNRIWRDTTQSPINTWEDPIYAQLLATVREANRAGGHVRLLAGDPPTHSPKGPKAHACFSFF